MNKENGALKLVDEIILHYDARSKKHQIKYISFTSTNHPDFGLLTPRLQRRQPLTFKGKK